LYSLYRLLILQQELNTAVEDTMILPLGFIYVIGAKLAIYLAICHVIFLMYDMLYIDNNKNGYDMEHNADLYWILRNTLVRTL